MTREEKIEILEMARRKSIYDGRDRQAEALTSAIKALEQEPTTKNDLGVDAVNREAVLDLIADYDLSMGQVVKGIHALPSVTPQEPKTGHWIKYPHNSGIVVCNQCKGVRRDCRVEYTNYCNRCGARMIEPQKRSE